MTFAITGANGFLGVHIIHHLLSQGHSVLGIIRPSASKKLYDQISVCYDLNGSLSNNIEWVECELFDTKGLEDIFKRSDYVMHLAGYISYLQKDVQQLTEINVNYTANVVDVALSCSVKKLLYCSSIGAISKSGRGEEVNESNEWDAKLPYSNYGLSKYMGENEVWRGLEEGLPSVIINPGVVLGYGNWNKGSNSLFKNAFNEFKFYSKGITGFVGVKDVAIIASKLCTSVISGERFIVVEENYSYEKIAKTMAHYFEKKVPRIEVKGMLLKLVYAFTVLKEWFRIGGLLSKETVNASVAKNKLSNTKIIEAIGVEFTPIEKVIEEAINWYKKSPPK